MTRGEVSLLLDETERNAGGSPNMTDDEIEGELRRWAGMGPAEKLAEGRRTRG